MALSSLLLASLTLVIASALAACRAPTPPRGEVQREWNTTLRELGINPVYPPREDLQVGDVYVRRGYVDDEELVPRKGFAPIDLWLANVASGRPLNDFYAARASLPHTPPPQPSVTVLFAIDALTCPHCGGKRKLIALINERTVVRKILAHLGLPTDPPALAPARAPPEAELAFDA